MNVMQVDHAHAARPVPVSRVPVIGAVLRWSVAFLLVAGLFGRIMTFPLAHDEEIHVAAARLIFREPLYGGLGYNHLPGLPLLLGGFYAATGSDHLLQTGRVLVFLCWVATAATTGLIAKHHTDERRVGVAAVLVLAAGTLLGPAGMLVTNNMLPIPFALIGFHLFVVALDDETIQPAPMLASGAALAFAIVLKISYVFLVPPFALAALLAPRGLGTGERIRLVLLPLLAGAILGGLPVLLVLAGGPEVLLAHTVRYFTGGHLEYWRHSADPKAMTLAAKMLVAEDVWLSGAGLLAGVLVGTSGAFLARTGRNAFGWWPLPLALALAVLGAAVAFAPTPAFPQYYEPPVPFLIVLFILLYRRLDGEARRHMQPLLGTAALLALAIILPRIFPAVGAAVRPARWTGNVVHDESQRIRAALAVRKLRGKVATLSPIAALEGGLPIYREFAAGPFLYRVADYLPARDRGMFVTTSPGRLPRFLDAEPPAAIVTGREPELDPAFVAYARSRGYVAIDLGNPGMQLFVRPPDR